MSSLYIHIPFCIQKCLYCDFVSFAGKQYLYSDYTEALLSEIIKKSDICHNDVIQTIFFGGGTPTILPITLLEKILNTIFQYYTVSPHAEITIEANPGTLSFSILHSLRSMGFQRISIGLQSWQNELLHSIGRIHNRTTFLQNFYHARKAGFENINVDIMFCLPNQTYSQWQETLYSIVHLQPEHISAYSLILEQSTPLFTLFEQNKITLPDEILDRAMYHTAQNILSQYGYEQYEISNFSKKGYQSRHNKVYWQTRQYLGFGLGAHSFWQNTRFHNTYDIKKYIQSKGIIHLLTEDVEHLTISQQQSEFMFMGLRMTEGISAIDFQKRFSVSLDSVYGKQIHFLMEQNLIQQKQHRYFLTHRGIDLSNTVFCEFL